MPIQALLFDLDGTLLNTLEDLADVTNRVLTGYGFSTHPTEAYKMMIGDGLVALMTRALPEAARGDEQLREALERWNADYEQHWKDKTAPYPGIEAMLDALTARGLPLTVFSNKPDGFTRLAVEELLGRWTFAAVRGARPDTPRKPDPTGALEIARQLSLPPQDFLYLGDSSTDMLTARAAGMVAVGVLWGFRSRAELLESGAQFLLEEPAELLKLLGDCTNSPDIIGNQEV